MIRNIARITMNDVSLMSGCDVAIITVSVALLIWITSLVSVSEIIVNEMV
jgi:hypothetical protein